MIIPNLKDLTDKDLEIIETIPRYPKIQNTELAKRDCKQKCFRSGREIGNPFLNIMLWIELKRDGSNIRLFKLSKDRYGVMSRNQYADSVFLDMVYEILQQDKHKGILKLLDEGHIVFVELFGKGNSPTGFDSDTERTIEVFDILAKDRGIIPRPEKIQLCEKYAIPIVPLIYSGKVKSYKEYYEVIDKALKRVDEQKKEGVVIKAYYDNVGQVYAKEKVEKAVAMGRQKPKKIEKPPKDFWKLVDKLREKYDETLYKKLEKFLPPLDISEINGCINKAHTELGDNIYNKAVAMPRIVEMVREEAISHIRQFPRIVYNCYRDYLKRIALEQEAKRHRGIDIILVW